MQVASEHPLDILLVEHEADLRSTLAEQLAHDGHRIAPFASISEAARDTSSAHFDLAFLPADGDAFRLALARLHQRHPSMRFVLTAPDAARPELDARPEVVGRLPRPVPVESAKHFARCVAELRTREEQLADARVALSQSDAPPVLRPRNTRMRRVLDRARQLAPEPLPLLLRGESGVGKCVLARWIHQWGHAADAPLLVLRAAADQPWLPGPLAGLLRRPDAPATVVLPEIAAFSLADQGQILALLEPSAAANPASSSRIRLIATTSEDLSEAARQGKFRQELLSLLMDESLYLPPLRERPEDIPAFAEGFLAHFARVFHRPGLSLEAEAILALGRHAWPANIHELQVVIQRAALLSKRPHIAESDLRLGHTSESGCNRSGEFLSLDALEKQQILRVIRAAPTLEEAARILKVDLSTLWRKRRRYGV